MTKHPQSPRKIFAFQQIIKDIPKTTAQMAPNRYSILQMLYDLLLTCANADEEIFQPIIDLFPNESRDSAGNDKFNKALRRNNKSDIFKSISNGLIRFLIREERDERCLIYKHFEIMQQALEDALENAGFKPLSVITKQNIIESMMEFDASAIGISEYACDRLKDMDTDTALTWILILTLVSKEEAEIFTDFITQEDSRFMLCMKEIIAEQNNGTAATPAQIKELKDELECYVNSGKIQPGKQKYLPDGETRLCLLRRWAEDCRTQDHAEDDVIRICEAGIAYAASLPPTPNRYVYLMCLYLACIGAYRSKKNDRKQLEYLETAKQIEDPSIIEGNADFTLIEGLPISTRLSKSEGLFYSAYRRLDCAANSYMQALKDFQIMPKPLTLTAMIDQSKVQNNLAVILRKEFKLAEAIKYYGYALKSRNGFKDLKTGTTNMYARSLTNRGLSYMMCHDFQQASEDLTEAHCIRRELCAKDSKYRTSYILTLASCAAECIAEHLFAAIPDKSFLIRNSRWEQKTAEYLAECQKEFAILKTNKAGKLTKQDRDAEKNICITEAVFCCLLALSNIALRPLEEMMPVLKKQSTDQSDEQTRAYRAANSLFAKLETSFAEAISRDHITIAGTITSGNRENGLAYALAKVGRIMTDAELGKSADRCQEDFRAVFSLLDELRADSELKAEYHYIVSATFYAAFLSRHPALNRSDLPAKLEQAAVYLQSLCKSTENTAALECARSVIECCTGNEEKPSPLPIKQMLLYLLVYV